MDLSYHSTLIAVADDCPVDASVVPTGRGGRSTVAVVQYGLLVDEPYAHTQEDVLFESWLRRQDLPAGVDVGRLRADFLARPQACLRASPLPKKHGFGLLFDDRGRVALCPMESAEYADIVAGRAGDVRVLKAMRSRR